MCLTPDRSPGERIIRTGRDAEPALDTVGVDDVVRLRAVVIGGIDYETTMGGTAHTVQFWAYSAGEAPTMTTALPYPSRRSARHLDLRQPGLDATNCCHCC